MNRWVRFLGILGSVLLIFGVCGGLVLGFSASGPIELLMLLHILAGLVLIVVWFVISGFNSASQAGNVLKGRTARFGANLAAYSAVFIGLLFCLNWLINRHDKRWDLTEQGVYSLAPQTNKILAGLKKDLRVVAFKGIANVDEFAIDDLLKLISAANKGRVKTEFIDARSKPHLVDSYGMKQGNLIYLEYGDGTDKGISRINDASEETVANAILKLTRGDAKKIYYVEGHGEADLKSDLPNGAKSIKDALEDEHINVENILLAEKQKIPDDAAAVILMSPKKELLPQERDMLISYAEGGGRVLLFSDPRTTEDVRAIAEKFGISVGNDIVVDQVQRLFAGPALGVEPVVRDYGTHAITANFSPRDITIFNQTVSVSPANSDSSKDGANLSIIARTGKDAWAEKNLSAIFDTSESSALKDAEDLAGPVSLAVAYEKNIEDKDAKSEEGAFKKATRVVVFGDSDWALNANLKIYSHRDFLLNSLNWLIGEEGGISIRPRSIRTPELTPITTESYLLMLAASFLIPELIFITGLIVWWRRRTALA